MPTADRTFGERPPYGVESIDNALRVVVLVAERESVRLSEVSRHLGVASSTAHRLLSTLVYRGFVQQTPTSRAYVPGPALDGLALTVLRRLDVRGRARPVLERLSTEVRETVHLGRLDGADVHFVDSVESTRALRVGARYGRSMPAHCTSTGKALLATLTVEQVVQRLPGEQLTQLTPVSIGSRTALLVALEQVRTVGYATCVEESEEGVGSVAVALPGLRSPTYALNVSMPVSRMTPRVRRTVLEHLRAAAGDLDRLLP